MQAQKLSKKEYGPPRIETKQQGDHDTQDKMIIELIEEAEKRETYIKNLEQKIALLENKSSRREDTQPSKQQQTIERLEATIRELERKVEEKELQMILFKKADTSQLSDQQQQIIKKLEATVRELEQEVQDRRSAEREMQGRVRKTELDYNKLLVDFELITDQYDEAANTIRLQITRITEYKERIKQYKDLHKQECNAIMRAKQEQRDLKNRENIHTNLAALRQLDNSQLSDDNESQLSESQLSESRYLPGDRQDFHSYQNEMRPRRNHQQQ